jgi:hypothetical protein
MHSQKQARSSPDPTTAGQLIDRYRSRTLVLSAQRQGMTTATFLEGRGPALTPERVGAAIVELAVDAGHASGGYQITHAGLSPIR